MVAPTRNSNPGTDSGLTHAQFVAAYRAGVLSVQVNQSLALSAVASGAVSRPRRAAHQFWAWIWFLSIPAAIIALALRHWTLGVGLVSFCFLANRAITRSAAEFALEESLKNAAFYERAVSANVLRFGKSA